MYGLWQYKYVADLTIVFAHEMCSWFWGHRMDLQGNRFSKKALQNMDGFAAFRKRRKDRIDKGLHGGVKPNVSMCGFD